MNNEKKLRQNRVAYRQSIQDAARQDWNIFLGQYLIVDQKSSPLLVKIISQLLYVLFSVIMLLFRRESEWSADT